MYFTQNLTAVVFDDHKLFVDTFYELLDRTKAFRSVFGFSEEKELIQFFKKNPNQQEIYFFVDYYLQDKHSIPLLTNIRKLKKDLKVIMVTSTTSPLSIQNILSYNPDGFLSKASGYEETLDCINAIKNNESYICPFISNLIDKVVETSPNLFTTREIEVLQYFDQGYSVADTADKINLSKHTVVEHRRHMMEKANCNSITELLSFSRKRGII